MNNMNAIRWVFFDIGSTLVDEEEAYHHRIRDMIRGTSITFEEFSEKRIQYAKEGYNGDLTSAQAGSIGGEMVKKMIRKQEQQMGGK